MAKIAITATFSAFRMYANNEEEEVDNNNDNKEEEDKDKNKGLLTI